MNCCESTVPYVANELRTTRLPPELEPQLIDRSPGTAIPREHRVCPRRSLSARPYSWGNLPANSRPRSQNRLYHAPSALNVVGPLKKCRIPYDYVVK